jgi:hypothetical protein
MSGYKGEWWARDLVQRILAASATESKRVVGSAGRLCYVAHALFYDM